MALPHIASTTGFQTLLVATDCSPRSRNALSCAAALARSSNAKVVIAHVISPDTWHIVPPGELHPALCHERRNVERRLAGLLKAGGLSDVRTDTVIKEGDFRQVLCEIASEQKADLLVASTHGRKGLRKLLFGSKVEEVCHRAPCPVLLVGPKVREGNQLRFQRVLYATDLSPLSLAALPLALAFVAQHHAQMKVARILEQPTSEITDASAFALAQTKNEILPAVTQRAGLKSEPEFEIAYGSAKEAILRVAAQWNADLIGIGSHRPGSLAVYLPGDLAYDVACDAGCPVLTIVDH